MPVYEFACNACGAPVSVFVRSISAEVNATCGRCGSPDLRRLVSRFAVLRPAGDLGSLDDDSLLDGLDESNPQAMAAWARRMQRETGEDLGPEFDEAIEQMEAGEMPDEFGGGGPAFGESYGDGYGDDFDNGADAEE